MNHLEQEDIVSAIKLRLEKLREMGDGLITLDAQVEWEKFHPLLERVHKKERKSKAGAKPIDVVLMFKMLVLQSLYNLSDHQLEYQVRDRLSFMRFLGLDLFDRVPDEKSVWLFREKLKEQDLIGELFDKFYEQLAAQGYAARKGQIMDASFVEVPKQRNTREENAEIKAGEVPEKWDETPHKKSQKDVDARWAKKNNELHYGYKNHANVDQKNKLIQKYAVTNAAVHDSQVFKELLDHTKDKQGKKRPVYGDSAYRSEAHEKQLALDEIESQINEKGKRNHPLTEEQKQSNRKKSKVRARVEHIFGAQAAMNGDFIRTIGILRAQVKIGLVNLVYNMVRLGQLLKMDATKADKKLNNNHLCGKNVPVVA